MKPIRFAILAGLALVSCRADPGKFEDAANQAALEWGFGPGSESFTWGQINFGDQSNFAQIPAAAAVTDQLFSKAATEGGGTDDQPSDWRSAIRSEFPFRPADGAAVAAGLDIVQMTAADANVVVLAPFIVRDSRINFNEMSQRFRTEEKMAKKAAMAAKLGFGGGKIYDNGKISIGYCTIFHIPFCIGMSW